MYFVDLVLKQRTIRFYSKSWKPQLFVGVFSILIHSIAFGQVSPKSDLDLIEAKVIQMDSMPKRTKPTFGLIGKSIFSRYNPFSLLLSSSLYVYQGVMSQQIFSNCPYEMSCSNFAKQSLKEFGLFKGVALATDRLTRCNRLSSADFHPIRFNKNGKVEDFPSYYHLEH